MPFHLDFNKTLDENLQAAANYFNFTPMSTQEILAYFKSVPQSGGMDPATAAAMYAAGKIAGYMILRDGTVYVIGGGATAVAGTALFPLAAVVAGAVGLWYILPSFLHEGGGQITQENSILLESSKPLLIELFNFMGSRYYEHIGAYAKGLFAKKCGKKNASPSTFEITEEEYKLLQTEFALYLEKSIVRKTDLSVFKKSNTKINTNRNTTRKSNQNSKYNKAYNTIKSVIKDPFFYL